jgi:hypothetical protein
VPFESALWPSRSAHSAAGHSTRSDVATVGSRAHDSMYVSSLKFKFKFKFKFKLA